MYRERRRAYFMEGCVHVAVIRCWLVLPSVCIRVMLAGQSVAPPLANEYDYPRQPKPISSLHIRR